MADENKMVRAFTFEDVPVRTIVREGNKWREWFVAADVCKILGIKGSVTLALDGHPNQPGTGLEGDEKGVDTINTPGGLQQIRMVNEPGLYKLIFKSRLPAAKDFQHWVIHEVLPELRRKGIYGLNTDGKDYNVALSLLPGMILGARQIAESMGLPYDNNELIIRIVEQWQDRYGQRLPFGISGILERATNDPALPEMVDEEKYVNLSKLCKHFGLWTISGNAHTVYLSRLLKQAGIHQDARFGKANIRTIKDKAGRRKSVIEWFYAQGRTEAFLEQLYTADTWRWPTYLWDLSGVKKLHHAVRYTETALKAWWVSMKSPFKYTRLNESDIDQLEFDGSRDRVNFGVDSAKDGNILVICMGDETLHTGFSAIWSHLYENDPPLFREFCTNYNINEKTGEPQPLKLVTGKGY